jgi:hypothetical protein
LTACIYIYCFIYQTAQIYFHSPDFLKELAALMDVDGSEIDSFDLSYVKGADLPDNSNLFK